MHFILSSWEPNYFISLTPPSPLALQYLSLGEALPLPIPIEMNLCHNASPKPPYTSYHIYFVAVPCIRCSSICLPVSPLLLYPLSHISSAKVLCHCLFPISLPDIRTTPDLWQIHCNHPPLYLMHYSSHNFPSFWALPQNFSFTVLHVCHYSDISVSVVPKSLPHPSSSPLKFPLTLSFYPVSISPPLYCFNLPVTFSPLPLSSSIITPKICHQMPYPPLIISDEFDYTYSTALFYFTAYTTPSS